MKEWVLFAIGPDQPGLVSSISGAIHDGGGNLEDSRMAMLAGDFALIVLFSVPDDKTCSEIESRCQTLTSSLPITIHIRKASGRKASQTGEVRTFTATGHDQPGIVRRLTQILADHGANVISMDTSLAHLAFHGTPMFRITGELQIPAQSDIQRLRDQLEHVCEDMELLLEFALS